MYLSLTDQQFFCLTPRQFHLMIDRHEEQIKHAELLSGIIASQITNHSMARPETLTTPSDFMPSERGKRPVVTRRRQPSKALRSAVDSSIRAFFGPLAKSNV